MASPLQGTLVVDLSRHLPGPLAGRLLADLGARVVKVEEPSLGDPIRTSLPVREGVGALGAILLAGVESLALDLKAPAAKEVLERLLARADVLLESFRPGTLARLGFPPEELQRRFPGLVICSLTGWGQSGPYAARAGHDVTYQAAAGTLASTASMPALPVVDLIGGWSAVTAILAALVERERTRKGRWIDASLYDAGLHANLVGWAMEAGGPKGVAERLPLTGALPCYDLYETADGRLLALGALEPHFWKRLCHAIDRGDLARRQYSASRRVRRQVKELVRGRTLAQWMEVLGRVDVPAEPVLSAAEARSHPQAIERALLSAGPDRLPRVAFPARFDGERPRPGGATPELGEHTKSILAELGVPRDVETSPGVGRRFSLKRWLRTVLR
ncbi:MAG TPA: CaiB/BaiF CoA-transferase family protein [Thermoanaerobaculia bacterium]|nr:CaiB/BaiF CoA-transferase family protein [Thermoanaerobaculia bacterium]